MRMSFKIRPIHHTRRRPQVLGRTVDVSWCPPQLDTGCSLYKRLWILSVRKKRAFNGIDPNRSVSLAFLHAANQRRKRRVEAGGARRRQGTLHHQFMVLAGFQSRPSAGDMPVDVSPGASAPERIDTERSPISYGSPHMGLSEIQRDRSGRPGIRSSPEHLARDAY